MSQNATPASLTKTLELTTDELGLLDEVLTACTSEEDEGIRMLEESEWLMLESLMDRVRAAKAG